mgnify:FL=1
MILFVNISCLCWGYIGGKARNIDSIKLQLISLVQINLGVRLGVGLSHDLNHGINSDLFFLFIFYKQSKER